MTPPRIVVIGGGAGGLELATRLGNKLGRKKRAHITLVDRNHTHIWKPLLHEVATGTLDVEIDQLSYRAHAASHNFEFQLGRFTGINREKRTITLAAIASADGEQLLAERELSYDYLVLAIGSISNHFNTPGVAEHCIFLDSPAQAHRFQRRLLDAYLKLNSPEHPKDKLNIAIVGGGATGVELAAELYHAAAELNLYGFADLRSERLNIHLVEAGPRILPALPERIASAAHKELLKLGVKVRVDTRVTAATAQGLTLGDEQLDAELMVWAAGIKAPDFMQGLAGLETNRINQLLVNSNLQSSRDPCIYVIGDCAACPLAEGKWVPPRAQSAHQMASLVAKNLIASLNQKPLHTFQYKDHGSLISLSRFGTVGSLMGNLVGGAMMIEGRIARLAYISLYRMHQVALHGWLKMLVISLVARINRIVRPRLKLH
ncbi:NAD(P)/FAD-dependent oxidoreductase [Arsukibacterium sp. UBA3155]|uniref:NAD(P)/FAD-dependent oxidoreductase n=1 Tax=Arsukibacterium sp. UBA3155 TaxID=1946058 RepID=UPI0025C1C53A|nr:NAD(P)/FAD-dependent oxidoreductase [Arsukibacterium sp. UBA3155]|tara:strand:- start:71379 stop:72674 length:1296 start_codon:yes stop_codon:yes gene_type:complete